MYVTLGYSMSFGHPVSPVSPESPLARHHRHSRSFTRALFQSLQVTSPSQTPPLPRAPATSADLDLEVLAATGNCHPLLQCVWTT